LKFNKKRGERSILGRNKTVVPQTVMSKKVFINCDRKTLSYRQSSPQQQWYKQGSTVQLNYTTTLCRWVGTFNQSLNVPRSPNSTWPVTTRHDRTRYNSLCILSLRKMSCRACRATRRDMHDTQHKRKCGAHLLAANSTANVLL